MLHRGGGGVVKVPKSVTYYLSGPKHALGPCHKRHFEHNIVINFFLSFCRNIVSKNVSCDMILTENFNFEDFQIWD